MDGAGANNLLQKFDAMGAGAAGGFLGPLTLLAELRLTDEEIEAEKEFSPLEGW